MLRVDRLAKRFGGYQALADVGLVVEPGSVHAVIGPNGAGKTTLFNVITGILPPTAGSVALEGRDITGWRADRVTHAGIARTFQQVRLFRGMNAVENVMVGRHARTHGGFGAALVRPPFRERGEEAETRRRARELLEVVGLAARADTWAGDLTLVEQRRLEVARALASDPRLLLLDEPAGGMTPVEVEDLNQLIRKIRESGVTVVLVEHHVRLVMRVSDVVTVLDAGRVIATGPPDRVRQDPRVIAAYLGREA
ncbi:MAG TPA: ABC transporter ATP-binding protein [Methylomirabilota bacterium]|jgi:branched-chain amino acid transport system ATP-binding protein|nr:ABC transporter ATP-binding protein [Methylomirabilota bacterium]